jgi:deoxyribodipyrimidine photo-lyase
MIVASASYIRYFSTILKSLSIELTLPVIQIDDASLLPPWIASDHEEYAAYTLRKKYWETFSHLSPEKESPWKKCHAISLQDDSKKIIESSWYRAYESSLNRLSENNTTIIQGGEITAQKQWEYFKIHTLESYDVSRNNPNIPGTSLLSQYLHF